MQNVATPLTAEPDTSDNRRRLHPDERRELLVRCAARHFSDRRYSQVSTVAIAKEAGIARGLLNHYFKDKRGLYLEVVRRSVLLPLLENLPPRIEGTPREQVDAAVEWFLNAAQAQAGSYFSIAGAESVTQDEDVAEIIREADDLAARRVLELVGVDDNDDVARAQVRCYGGMAKATVYEWVARESLTREQAHNLLREVLLFMKGSVLPGHHPS
jgi:AcrR family transcriptional regulator